LAASALSLTVLTLAEAAAIVAATTLTTFITLGQFDDQRSHEPVSVVIDFG
jgi:hypothetical protein